LAVQGSRAPVWLPPLDIAPNLDELLGGLVTDPSGGLHREPSLRSSLTVPMALVDKPFEQRGTWSGSTSPGPRPRRHRGQSAEREVHRRTVAHHRARLTTRRRGPGLLPRLRRRQLGRLRDCRTSAASRAGGHGGGAADVGEVATCSRDGNGASPPRHRLGHHLPAAAPTVRSGRHAGVPEDGFGTCSSSSTAGPRCAASSRTSRGADGHRHRGLSTASTWWRLPPVAGLPQQHQGPVRSGWKLRLGERATRPSTARRRERAGRPAGRGINNDGRHAWPRCRR
jgi:hypothetical protein